MDLMKYKTMTIRVEGTTKNRDALLFAQRDAGWKWCGLDKNENPNEETLKFEKKFPVGDVVEGMLEWIENKSSKRSESGMHQCQICHTWWHPVDGEYHTAGCPIPSFKEAFGENATQPATQKQAEPTAAELKVIADHVMYPNQEPTDD